MKIAKTSVAIGLLQRMEVGKEKDLRCLIGGWLVIVIIFYRDIVRDMSAHLRESTLKV